MDLNSIVTFADFIATGRDMKASEFGRIINDSQWDDIESADVVFRVYQDTYYIERLLDGTFLLNIGNNDWMTNGALSLRELEYRLWKYALSEGAHECLSGLAAKEASGEITDQDRMAMRLLNVLVDVDQDIDVFDMLSSLVRSRVPQLSDSKPALGSASSKASG